MIKKVNLGLIGAGNRGQGIFGQYALDMPHRAQFTMVVEPDAPKREQFARMHKIPAERCFASIREMEKAELKDLDGVVIATIEDERFEPIRIAMARNWHILVEKPLCTNEQELIRLYDACIDYKQILIVCHQMRLTPIYKTIKSLVDSGRYGTITCLQHSENLCYSHMAHSFVRGFFNNSRLTPMLLAKSCHDMDILTYITGRKINKVSSFGSLNYFRKENCPPGAPEFCLEGCPHSKTCPFDVMKIYFDEYTDPAYIRQLGVVRDKDHLRELMLRHQFGRCVFQSDNDVVDNQVVSVEMDDSTTSSFTMCGTNGTERRMMKISLTNGEIEYRGLEPKITVWSFEPNLREEITVKITGTHSGGDRAIMENFCDAIVTGDRSILLTPLKDSLEGHLLVFAAEEARRNSAVVDIREFENRTRASLK
jgi:predicted dehydrogenase